jgi:predicted nucleotidyltransferase
MRTETTRFGLTETTRYKINAVFARYPQCQAAILYGSRAKGNYHNGSDIDLTLIGEALGYDELLRIETELDDLLLPYQIDLSLHQQLTNPDLLAHIQRVGQVFFTADSS